MTTKKSRLARPVTSPVVSMTLQYGACHLNGHLLVRVVITGPTSIDHDIGREMTTDRRTHGHRRLRACDSVIAGQYLSLLCNGNSNCNPGSRSATTAVEVAVRRRGGAEMLLADDDECRRFAID